MSTEMITVKWINDTGGGLMEEVRVAKSTTVKEFLALHLPNRDLNTLKIRLNNDECSGNQTLFEGDRLSATAAKYTGA